MDLIDLLSSLITTIFLFFVLSYYILLFFKNKKTPIKNKFKSVSIIVPAHNEESYIYDTLVSIENARFDGKKQIIVVDDGSIDNTSRIVKKFKNVKLLKTKHIGKSASINLALKTAVGELIAIIDADSTIEKNAIYELTKELGRSKIVAATGVVRVKNRSKFICMWVHIEQLYNSLMRLILAKINANITTPGPISMYRTDALKKIGGFSTQGFSEDLDVTIRLIRMGYKIGYTEMAISNTNMPYDPKGFFRQRTRFARGMINILKRHMQMNTGIIDIYTLPLFLFTYVQAVIMASITLYQIFSGYYQYFISKGVHMSFAVIQYFFEWFSIVGFIKWLINVLTGSTPFNFLVGVGIISTILTYPLYFVAIVKFDRKIDLYHLIPIFFMAPYWLLIMIIYIAMLPEIFIKKQYNKWKKNE